MDLIPGQDDVIALLFRTGALREGHFKRIDGIHTDQWLETALALRRYEDAKLLSVALSRLIRADSTARPALAELSIVAASVSGIPVAYGVAEALHPKQVYWVERGHLPQFVEPRRGEKALVVDDVLRSGRSMAETAELLEERGVEVLGIAALFSAPDPTAISFGRIPVYSLARLPAARYFPAAECALCRQGVPLQGQERTLAASFA